MITPPRVEPGATIGVVTVATPAATRAVVERGDGLGPDWPRERTIDDVLDARLGSLGVPVLYGLPVGHGETMVTLPLGVQAALDADAKTLTIDEPALG